MKNLFLERDDIEDAPLAQSAYHNDYQSYVGRCAEPGKYSVGNADLIISNDTYRNIKVSQQADAEGS